MKKYLISLCLVFVFAFTSGFLISHFTTQSSKANSGGGDVSQDCGHDAQIQMLMREIEIRQDRIKDLEQRIDFCYEVLIELLNGFDIQYEWIEELLGQTFYYQELINQANAEILELERQIAELQRQLVPANWNGVWGQYWHDGDELVFEEIVTIENGVFIFAIDDEAEFSVKILGNTLIIFLQYPESNKNALVFTYCTFNDYFILSDWIVLFTEEDYEEWFDDYEIKPFLDTDYFYFSIISDNAELIRIVRGEA